MKITIPTKPYYDFLEKCDPSRGEYETLRNGFVRQDDGAEVVEIHCDPAAAVKLLDLARQMKLGATFWIEKSLGF